MTVKWTHCSSNGSIIATGVAMDVEQANLQATGGGYVILDVQADPVTQVVQNPATTPIVVQKTSTTIGANKTAFIANGVDSVTISSIQAGSTVSVLVPDNTGLDPISPFVVNDGSLVITTDVAGAYQVVVTDFPRQDFSVTLNAT